MPPPRPEPTRCDWSGVAGASGEAMIVYHDTEWGVPLHDDRALFEFLVLEGAQAGLSWSTILNRRDGYRRAFAGFDPEAVARFDDADVERLLADPGIVRNRAKIRSAITNARRFVEVVEEHGSFAAYQWAWVDGEPVRNRWRSAAEVPASTPLSEAFSRDLKRRGFTFVGPTIVYAHMQATGMVNDHTVDCFRHREVEAVSR